MTRVKGSLVSCALAAGGSVLSGFGKCPSIQVLRLRPEQVCYSFKTDFPSLRGEMDETAVTAERDRVSCKGWSLVPPSPGSSGRSTGRSESLGLMQREQNMELGVGERLDTLDFALCTRRGNGGDLDQGI